MTIAGGEVLTELSFINTEIDRLLREWGKWARQCPSHKLAYPTVEPFRRLYHVGDDERDTSPNIDDETAIRIDRALAHMSLHQKYTADATVMYYFSMMNYIEIAEFFGINRKQSASLVANGVNWVSGFVFSDSQEFVDMEP